MASLLKADISQTFGQTFIDDIFLQRSRYYYSVGRSYPWENDIIPEEVIDSEKYEKATRRDILFCKQIQGTSVSFIIDRYNYQPNISYDKYDDFISMENKRFYVLNSDFNVYKCLDNNAGGISTQEPYGTSPSPIRLNDNYVWQFIYTIPPSLRAKFLSDQYMPVYNAITEKYYSRGTISAIRINSGGKDYVQATTDIIVSGDGYLADNPFKLTNFVLAQKGSGYSTAPVAETEDQFSNYVSFSGNLNVIKGQYLKVSDTSGVRFYEVISAGVTSTVTPTHYYSTTSNGTSQLKHVGTKPKITTEIDDAVIGKVNILDPGFGYSSIPGVTVPGPGVNLQASLTGGTVSSIQVIDGGLSNTSQDVIIDAPYPSAVVLPDSESVALDSIYYFVISGSTYFYRVDSAGITDSVGPTHTNGTATNGTAVLTVVGKTAKAEAILGVVTTLHQHFDLFNIRLLDGGSGYDDITTEVQFVGGDPDIPAFASATISGGVITDINIQYPGYGYKSTPTINIISTGSGTGASAIAIMQSGYGYKNSSVLINFSEPDDANGHSPIAYSNTQKTEAILEPIVIDGILRGVRVIDGAVGYTQAVLTVIGAGTGAQIVPIFASSELNTIQAQSELLSTAGTLSSVYMENIGDNITSVNISIEGDGSGAEVSPVVIDGQMVRIDVTNIGTNYTYMNIIIQVNPDATPPVARAIIAPLLGHGSNPIKELYSKSIALNVTLGNENNNGFDLANSFRQISIIKSPLLYGKTKMLETLTGSACAVAYVNLGSVPLEKNHILTNTTDNSQYRVIDFTSSKLLLQSITNGEILPGNSLKLSINNIDYNINVEQISNPDFDKQTGDILYIDNQIAFSPSINQSVNIITTISLT